MSVHVEPIVFTIRCFAEGKGWGDEYKVVLTVQKCGEVGYCSGCHGDFSVMDYREFERKMLDYGITDIRWTRHASSNGFETSR